MRLHYIAVVCTLLLAACGSGEFSDLKEFVDNSRGSARPRRATAAGQAVRADHLQRVRLPDPFKPRKIEPDKTPAAAGPAPDLNRRKEPLEAYPLESLKMVGTLERGNQR